MRRTIFADIFGKCKATFSRLTANRGFGAVLRFAGNIVLGVIVSLITVYLLGLQMF